MEILNKDMKAGLAEKIRREEEKRKKKQNIFDKRNQQLEDIYNYQQGK